MLADQLMQNCPTCQSQTRCKHGEAQLSPVPRPIGSSGGHENDSAEIVFRKLEVTIQIFVQGPSMSHFTGPLRNKGNCHGSHKKIVWCIWLKKKGRSFLAGWSDPLDCNPAAIVRLLVVAEWGSFSVLPKRTAHIRQCLSRLHMSHNTL